MGLTAKAARAELDRILRRYGEDCTLQRLMGAAQTPVAVELRATIVDLIPREIEATGLQHGDSTASISTTELLAARWPSLGEAPMPGKGDQLIVGDRVRTVLLAWPAAPVDGEQIRIQMVVR